MNSTGNRARVARMVAQRSTPYATASYGTSKIQKPSQDHQIGKLPIRPFISNIDIATYRLAKNLAKFLLSLSVSEYTVKSTKDFIEKLRTVKIPKG